MATKTRSTLVSLALAALLVGGAFTALADGADFHAIITNFGSAPRANAFLDVSFDSAALGGGPTDVIFEVFTADGANIAEFSVPVNPDGFASSASMAPPYNNLFRLTGGAPALVRARTVVAAVGGTATLHQRGQGSRLIVSVPADKSNDNRPIHSGTSLCLHVGDIRGNVSAALLVANVSGGDVTVDVFSGTFGAQGAGKYTMPALRNRNVWRVDLQPDDENTFLVVKSTNLIIAQLAIDDGRMHGITVLPCST